MQIIAALMDTVKLRDEKGVNPLLYKDSEVPVSETIEIGGGSPDIASSHTATSQFPKLAHMIRHEGPLRVPGGVKGRVELQLQRRLKGRTYITGTVMCRCSCACLGNQQSSASHLLPITHPPGA